jgi:hypothetical protein
MIRPAVHLRHGHGDDEARGAEAALAAVSRDHRRLHRVQRAIRAGDALDGAHRLAVQLRQEQDAGIQRPAAGRVGQHDGAGAAIALVAALLGAFQPAVLAQPVQQRPRRRRIADPDRRAVQQKRNLRHDMTRRLLPVQGRCAPARCGVKRSARARSRICPL